MGTALSSKDAMTTWAAADQMHVLAVGNLDKRMTLEDLLTEIIVSPVVKNSNGLDVDTTDGSDGDVDLLTCLVTGTPKLWWDESEDAFVFSKALKTTGKLCAVATKTTTYVLTDADECVVCNSTSAFTVTLPVATGSGRWYAVKNISTGTVTVDGNSSDTIDGSASVNLMQWEAVQLVDYAANKWVIV